MFSHRAAKRVRIGFALMLLLPIGLLAFFTARAGLWFLLLLVVEIGIIFYCLSDETRSAFTAEERFDPLADDPEEET